MAGVRLGPYQRDRKIDMIPIMLAEVFDLLKSSGGAQRVTASGRVTLNGEFRWTLNLTGALFLNQFAQMLWDLIGPQPVLLDCIV